MKSGMDNLQAQELRTGDRRSRDLASDGIAPAGAVPLGTGLEVTGQFLAFEPGLSAVEVLPGRSAETDVGLRLPCVRLEPLPASPGAGHAFVSGAAEGGWLSGGTAAFVLVTGGRTRVMLTVYKAAGGMAPPELRVRPLGAAEHLGAAEYPGAAGRSGPGIAAAASAGGASPTPAVPAVAPGTQAVPAMVPLPEPPAAADPVPVPVCAADTVGTDGRARCGVVLMTHVQGIGDLFADAAGWAGRAGSGAPVEGFSVMPENAGAGEIEYQAILGDQWNTPWIRGGGFCGSRGMALPILGFRVRLTGAAAERLECRYWGSFVGRGEVGPLSDGVACQAGQAFLEAVRIVVSPRATDASDPADVPPGSSGTAEPAPQVARRRGR